MKLYMHPVSTGARPVRLLLAEYGIACDEEIVDITQGAHHQEPYASLNPSRLVPMLDDDGFRLTESSAILKYIAEKYDLPCYPKDLKKRARVNALRQVLHTLDYADKDTTRIGDTDPLIVGPARTVYETGENPDRTFPTL